MTKFIGTLIDPWVLNYTAFRVFPEDDSIGRYTEPLFLENVRVPGHHERSI